MSGVNNSCKVEHVETCSQDIEVINAPSLENFKSSFEDTMVFPPPDKRPRLETKLEGHKYHGTKYHRLNVNIKAAQSIEPQVDASGNDEVSIEKEYSPHEWSTKYQTPEDVLQQYIDFITEESEIATDLIPHEADVTYGPATGQKLDIFGTDLPDNAPVLVFVHGGYWKQISKDRSRFPAVPLHKAGIKTIIVGYNRRKKATLWDILDQVGDGIIHALKYAEDKGSRGTYLAGHCGGANLIALVLANSEINNCRVIKKLKGVFFLSGLYDLRNFSLTSVRDSVKLERIDEISFSPLFSNYNHLERSKTRFYILTAQEDSPTFKKQSRDFYQLLFDICPMENMYWEIKDQMDHFDMVKCLTREDNYLKKFILQDLCRHS